MLRFVMGITAGLGLGFFVSSTHAIGPSFDCDRAKAPVEFLICSDDALAAMDLDVAKAFARALARAPASMVGELKTAQRNWRRELLACAKTSEPRACALQAFSQRLGEL